MGLGKKKTPYAYRLRAAYSEQSLCFEHTIAAITLPDTPEGRACGKLLTAILNSQFIAWYLFLTTRVGVDRERVLQDDILPLPFSMPENMPDPEAAQRTFEDIVNIMDDLIARQKRASVSSPKPLELHSRPIFPDMSTIEKLDQLVCDYFGLHQDERTIIKENLEIVRPAMHPSQKSAPALWEMSEAKHWQGYCQTLEATFQSWMQPDIKVSAGVIAASADLVVVRASLRESVPYIVNSGNDLRKAFGKLPLDLRNRLMIEISRNVQVLRALRVFFDDDLYLVKPRERRFWLTSAAQEDANALIEDLLFTKGEIGEVM